MDKFEEIKEHHFLGNYHNIKEERQWLISEIERLGKLFESTYKEGHFDASEDIFLAKGK